MGAFNLAEYIKRAGVDWIDSGPNVAKDNIYVKCPWCGENDPSYHMGIHIYSGVYGCWRDPRHAGGNPARLLRALLKISAVEAEQIVEEGTTADLSNFQKLVDSGFGYFSPQQAENQKKLRAVRLSLPRTAFRLTPGSSKSAPFVRSIVERGFSRKDIEVLLNDFELYGCRLGEWKNRIIFPVHYENNLVTWSGRSIYKKARTRRYKALSDKFPDQEGNQALRNVKECLLWFDRLMEDGGDTCYVLEGPFDALKVDFYGYEHGVRATCIFGLSLSNDQAWMIQRLTSRFKRVRIMMDPAAWATQMGMIQRWSNIGVESAMLNTHDKDPGDLTRDQINRLEELVTVLDV